MAGRAYIGWIIQAQFLTKIALVLIDENKLTSKSKFPDITLSLSFYLFIYHFVLVTYAQLDHVMPSKECVLYLSIYLYIYIYLSI